MSHGNELLNNYHFRVEIAGLEELHFAEVSGLGAEIEAIEYRAGSDVLRSGRIIPGRVSYPPVTLRRAIVNDLRLWEWFESLRQGGADFRTVVIQLLGPEHEPVVTFQLRNAWISKIEGPTLDATGNEIAIETIELTHEGLEVE